MHVEADQHSGCMVCRQVTTERVTLFTFIRVFSETLVENLGMGHDVSSIKL